MTKKQPSYSPAFRKLHSHLNPASDVAVIKQRPRVKAKGKAHSSLIFDGSLMVLPCREDWEAALSSLTCQQAPRTFGRPENNLTMTEKTGLGGGDSRWHKSETTCHAAWDGEGSISRTEVKSLGIHIC